MTLPSRATHAALATASLAVFALATPAAAQDPVDIGLIKNEDVRIVQKLLYPKRKRTELSAGLQFLPFDPFTMGVAAQFGFDYHLEENLSITATLGGGWSFANAQYNDLASARFGVAPDAYGYVASLQGGMAWAPIYAKLNLDGATVVHYDVYLAARVGVTLENTVVDRSTFAVSPTLTPAIGSRFFFGERYAIRLELRDDVNIQYRPTTERTFLKQNLAFTVAFSLLSPVKRRGR